ncbi:discoidin domain-containing protein [Verrucomicrobiaceae bacterium 5K15]|uniref:Discoidin domain-containing protein n=1 Tax=Oceaniferula flava TaxID=2800421 RepID=A0AAE2SCK7_9BACT|nr:glycosyl hydrolase [Oceaniferula flavus]MBK1855364.1 discoidin domain-containing protein [Oceaniferula flavus]MBM1136670.1 discoidin domain-containing protein [Oceaniferula flavus]
MLPILLGSSLTHAQTTVFEADFDAATAISGSVSANATASNLDAGTAIGSWQVSSAPGAIIATSGHTNNAFVFDRATSGQTNNAVTAQFSESIDLSAKSLTMEMDVYAVRQANNQAVLFSLDDASGNQAYEFTFQMNNTKKFLATSEDGSASISTGNTTGVNNGFKNPAVDGFLAWTGASQVHVKLEVTSTLAEISIDWNADGDYDDASEWVQVNIGPKDGSVSEISALRIANNGTLNGGAWIDNISVVAEDATAATTIHNLARYQTTSADSQNGSWPSQYATDGFATQDSRWLSTSGDSHWLQVELATPMTIGSAHLFTGGTWDAAMSNAELQYHDGNDWVSIDGASLTGNTSRIVNLEFTQPVTAQKFRLTTTDGTARVVELAMYAPTADGEPVPFGTDIDLNLAKLRQYAYSSIDGTRYPKLAIDGFAHDNSAWASADTAGPHDLEIHLAHAEKIAGIHLYSGYAGQNGTQISDFEVSYDDNGSWVVFDGGSITGNTELERSVQFTTSAVTKKIRIRSLDSTQAVIRELVALPELGGDWFPLWTDVSDEAPSSKSFLDYDDAYYTLENRGAGGQLSTSESGSELTNDEPWFQVLLNIGTDDYRIRSKDTEECFEVAMASTTAGAAVVEGTYSHMPHQRWQIIPVEDGYSMIVNLWSGMALGLDGTTVVQQVATGSANQQWKINYEKHFPKQGQASHFHFSHMFKPSWGYRWTYNDESLLQSGQYIPMQWGGMGSASPGILNHQPIWYGRANQTTVLGFNEPDLHDQANMEVETASYQWPRLERMRLPLGGPVPAAYKGYWRQDFEAAAEELGHRSEYMAVHWYSISGASTGSPGTLINNMKYLYDLYGKPIWLTEFSTRDFVGDKTTWSRAHNYNFLAEFMWRAESLDWLKRYSIFEWSLYGGDPDSSDASSTGVFDMNSPRLALHNSNDSGDPGWEDLSECGLLLAGWDGDDTVRDDKAYLIHNKGQMMRLIDHPDEASVTTADVSHRAATEQFMLVSAGGDKKYIVGLSDGRRLHYDGSSVGLSPAGTTGANVEWEIDEYQYGWFYVNHPSSGKRLSINSSHDVVVENNTVNNDNARFRFIAPAQPSEITSVQTLPYEEDFENGIGAWHQFSDGGYYWEVGTGGTPSSAAGPNVASSGNYYLFAEGHDSSSSADLAQAECKFDFSGVDDVELSFDYHMYGSYIDYVAVDVHDGNSWTNDVWVKNGQQHSDSDEEWSRAVVNLSAYDGNSSVTIRFRTKRTAWNSADPAIDNIIVRERVKSLPYIETFEQGFGSWAQPNDEEADWTRISGGTPTAGTGPAAASEGSSYVYFEGHDKTGGVLLKNKTASLQSTVDLSTVAHAKLTFDYHMFGVYIDYLTVDVYDGSTWTYDVWKKTSAQHSSSEDAWSTACVDLTPYVGNPEVTVRFTNKEKTWNSSDTALDNIRIEEMTSAYEIWAAARSVAGAFDADEDQDGIANGLEFVLNGDPMAKGNVTLPQVVSDATHMKMSYTRTAESKTSTVQMVQWSTDMNTWNDIIVPAGDPDEVTVSIPLSNAVNGQLFTRLKVTEATEE